MVKDLCFSGEARQKILNGMEKVSKAVGATLGPRGKLACIESKIGDPVITKDGVSVAESISLKDKYENLGASLIKSIANKSCDDTGDGPQPLYAKVLTPTGFREMGSLKAGDKICGINGDIQTVLATYDKGEKDLYRVYFDRDTHYVECSGDHLWTLMDDIRSRKGLTYNMTTSQMLERMTKKKCTLYTPYIKAQFNEKELPLDPFTLGVLIGDGSFTEKNDGVDIAIGVNKTDRVIPKLRFPEGITYHIQEVKERNSLRIKIKGKTSEGKYLKEILKDLGLYGCNSSTKFIPKDYLINSIENREKLLEGLVATDGYINKKGLIEYSTISEQLSKDIEFLMSSLGYTLYTYAPTRGKGAYSDTKVYRIYQLKGYKYGRKITSIKPMNKKEHMMCIKVSNDDELYITDNFIATHNTSTSTILGYALAKEGLEAMEKGVQPIDLKKGIDLAITDAIVRIKDGAKPIESADDIYNVAKVSSNNDDKIASLVSEAFEKVGNDGLISVADSNNGETHLSFKEGMNIDRGYISPYFINNDKMECEFKDSYILVTDESISSGQQIIKLLNTVAQTGKPLTIIADDIGGEVLPILIFNNTKGSIQVNAIKTPSFGENKINILQDIATLTGATLISEKFGKKVIDATLDDLGVCDKVVSSKIETLFIGGHGNKDDIQNRIESISRQIENENETNNETNIEHLKTRLAKLTGGVCILNVYAPTEVQLKELKDRVEDTLCSVRASIQDGVTIGGGVTLLRISQELKPSKTLTKPELLGYNLVKKILAYPIRKLSTNAGLDADKVIKETLSKKTGGYNMLTRKWDDNLIDSVVDPVLVEVSALENASSIVGLVLNTEVAIVENNDNDNNSNNKKEE